MKKLSYIFLLTILIYSCKDSTINPNTVSPDSPSYAEILYYSEEDGANAVIRKLNISSKEDLIFKQHCTLLNKPVDGRIFYQNGRENNIYSCDLDGKNDNLIFSFKETSYLLKLSNDGKKLIYTSKNSSQTYFVHFVNLANSKDTIIFSDKINANDKIPGFIEFTMDSKNFIICHFNEDSTSDFYLAKINDNNTINSVNKINKTKIYKVSNDFISNAISPNNQNIVIVHENKLSLLNINAGYLNTLINNVSGLYGPSWSPDGNYISFWKDRGTFAIIKSDGSNETVLKNETVELDGKNLSSWSDDSRHIFFSINKEYFEPGELYIADVITKELKSIWLNPMKLNNSYLFK